MTKEYTPEEIKYRLSDLGVQIGNIAINYITELEQKNAVLKKLLADTNERNLKVEEAYKKKFDAEWRLNELYQKLKTDYANAVRCSREYFARWEDCKKENAELKEKNKWYSDQVCNKECAEVWGNLDKATDLLKWFVWYFREGSPNLVPYKHKVAETEQFLNSEVGK